MRRLVKAASSVIAVALASVALATPAHAADTVVIRKVDTSNLPNVSLTVLKPAVSAANSDVKISENGAPVTNADIKTAAEANLPIGVVLVIDTSAAANAGGAFAQAKAAAIAMIDAKTANQSFAVVATNGTPRTVATFTTDGAALTNTINGLQASSQNALWSGVSLASQILGGQSTLQHNVVVLSASKDELSPDGAYSSAAASLRTNKAVAFTVALGEDVDSANLKDLASSTGGRFVAMSDPTAAPEVLAGLQQNLADQAVITYKSKATTDIDISVGIGNGVATAHVAANTVAEGTSVSPTVVKQHNGPAFLDGRIGLVLVAIVALAAVGLLLYGLIEIASRERSQLTSALRPYSDQPAEERDISRLADSEIIKKAVAAVGKSAEDRGLLQIIERRLEQADLPFRPAEALSIVLISAFVAMLIGAIFFKFIGIIIAAFVFLLFPLWVTGFLAKRRRSKFTRQLPDTLQLMAGSLRAGYSLVQGLDAVSKQTDAPMGPELVRAMSEARLGRPVEEALQEVSDRMGSDDFEWAVMAIKIQREVGGNLAELLMTVSETMIARERLRREVKSLTAEGRISAIVLAGLPPIIGVVISIINPGYMAPMFSNVLGQLALGVGAGMILVGYWLMMKMIQVEA